MISGSGKQPKQFPPTRLRYPEEGRLIKHESTLPAGISGYVPVRNGDKLDYCWREAVESLLPVCDEVWISIGLTGDEYGNDARFGRHPGDDGTFLAAVAMRDANPKIRLNTDLWDDSLVNYPNMLKEWLNRVRARLRYRTQLTLDADEILDPCAYPAIRELAAQNRSAWFYRINLWGDARHEAPWGTVCGEHVARMGPTEYPMVSDGPEVPEARIRVEAVRDPSLVIWHMGFLRKPEAFYAKSKVMQRRLHNCYDPRLTLAEETGQDWVKLCPFVDAGGNERPLLEHGRQPPPIAVRWLREHGFAV